MSKRNKLQKFSELLRFPNVFENFDPREPGLLGENGEPVSMEGAWRRKLFGNDYPLVLELACGHGDYTLELARRFPQKNFIGVDIKGARIWRGARIAQEEGLRNVAFLRTRIEQLHLFFAEAEVDEIWITFPDPFPRKSKINRRLTAPNFRQQYRKLLSSKGVVHLKTDADSLFEFSIETLAEDDSVVVDYVDDNIYAGPLPLAELAIKTFYERKHLADGKTIKYIRFRFRSQDQ